MILIAIIGLSAFGLVVIGWAAWGLWSDPGNDYYEGQ